MSDIATLIADLRSYKAWDEHEEQMRQQLLDFVITEPNCLWRTMLAGHITASAWVIHNGSALMIHHRKLDRWLQPGGHADGDPDTLAVAQREVGEETGLATRPIVRAIFDLDIHAIPARGQEPAHLHYDIRHLLAPMDTPHLHINSEVKAAIWVPLEEISQLTPERSVLRMVEKSKAFVGFGESHPWM